MPTASFLFPFALSFRHRSIWQNPPRSHGCSCRRPRPKDERWLARGRRMNPALPSRPIRPAVASSAQHFYGAVVRRACSPDEGGKALSATLKFSATIRKPPRAGFLSALQFLGSRYRPLGHTGVMMLLMSSPGPTSTPAFFLGMPREPRTCRARFGKRQSISDCLYEATAYVGSCRG